MSSASSISSAVLFVLCSLGLAACDDEPPSSPPVQPTPTQPPAPSTEPAELTEVEMVALMEGHYGAAIAGHDALIRGDLETFRARLTELQAHPLPPAAPEAWRSHEVQLHEASLRAGSARSLEDAATAMGAVAEACGACHTAVGLEQIYRRPEAPTADDPVETAMLTHQWATERLWEGITGPWDDAWMRGADALAQSRVFTREGEPVTSSLQAREVQMQQLGREAKTLTGLSERTALYGRLLATCGACHLEAGVTFPN